MKLEIWFDPLFPWCWIEACRLAVALDRRADGERVELAWRSYEILPDQPREPDEMLVDLMHRLMGTPREELMDRYAALAEIGASEGIEIDLANAQPVSSFDAHRVAKHAEAHGVGEAVRDALFRAYLAEHRNIADHDVLAAIAAEAGLDADAARAALGGDDHANEVRADEARAAELGIGEVPAYVLAGRVVATGPGAVDALLRELGEAG